MNGHSFTLQGAALVALPSGALWWPSEAALAVSDLHLGRSERYARRGGALLPPYETQDTLHRLDADIQATGARTVLCLGDSFDDLAAADALQETARLWLTRLMAGRRWLWVEGNHDPGPIDLPGSHLAVARLGPLTFRHMSEPDERGEISGHYHPKFTLSARGYRVTRPCFLIDRARVILPAYGTYTGGLSSADPALLSLIGRDAIAVLTGTPSVAVPLSPQRATTAS